MFRTLLPTTLALLLVPCWAQAAPLAIPGADSQEVSSIQGNDRAARAEKKKDEEKGSAKKSTSTRRTRGSKSGSSGSSKGGDEGDQRSGTRDGESRRGDSPGESGGDSRGDESRDGSRGGESPGGEPREDSRGGEPRDDGESRRTDPERGGPPSEKDTGDREQGYRSGPYGEDSRSTDRGYRSGQAGPDGSEKSEGGGRDISREGGLRSPGAGPAPLRSGAARQGGAPRLDQPTVRKVSVGSGTAGAASAPRADSVVRPSNFRSGDREAVDAGRGSRGEDGRGSRSEDSHASAERHGRGSDAERAHHAEGDRHREGRHEEARHARHMAGSHREAAHYRHGGARARHSAWASYRYRRYNQWYHPGGWFRPWQAGHTHWYHGVFLYGPYPWYHQDRVAVVYSGGGGSSGADGGGGTARDDEPRGPRRTVDRAGAFSVGIRGGSYLGAYNFDGGAFGDAGLGLAVRYRPVEAVGLELSWMHHDQTWSEGSERVYQPIQASVELFAAPWTRVNPYVLAGVTVTPREVDDDLGFARVNEASVLVGPHGGLGIEFGLGKKASINFDVRYTGYLNKPADDLTVPGAFQGNMGLNFYF